MNKKLKIVLVILGVIILVLLSGALYIDFSGIPTYEVDRQSFSDYKAEPTPARLERGKKLVSLLCANCHRNQSTGLLVGGQMKDAPPEFGTIYSQNITQDMQYGIGDWSDGELMYLLRTGIKRDGMYAPPYMAKLPHMSDEDIASVIAFLRSNDPMVAADHTADQPCEPSFLTKFLCAVAFRPMEMPSQPIPEPDTSNMPELGKYLATNLECFSCHSSDFKTNNYETPELSEGYFAGGNKPLDLDGHIITTMNLTPDKETGIGNWSEEKFIKAVKYGTKEGQDALRYPMVPYALLSDKEAGAIYKYLQTIPAINNKVVRSVF